jgi:hypothetical protein
MDLLDSLGVRSHMCRLDACQLLKPEVHSLIFPFLTCTCKHPLCRTVISSIVLDVMPSSLAIISTHMYFRCMENIKPPILAIQL